MTFRESWRHDLVWLDVFKNWVATTRNCQELAILVQIQFGSVQFSSVQLRDMRGALVTACTACFAGGHYFMQGCRVLCFGDEWFFADHYLQQGVALGSIFLPIIIGRSLFPAGSYVLGRFFLPSTAFFADEFFFRTNRAGGKSKNGNNLWHSCYSKPISGYSLFSIREEDALAKIGENRMYGSRVIQICKKFKTTSAVILYFHIFHY